MPVPPLNNLISVLQVSIGPVILISGVGLLLLSMTNRFGRAIDRSRQLAGEIKTTADPAACEKLHAQVAILYRRANLIRRSITLASLSILLVAVLIIALFFSELLAIPAAGLLVLIFVAAMLCLIGSMIAFIKDINLSLGALDHEVQSQDKTLK